MSHYEAREKTPEWEALVHAHETAGNLRRFLEDADVEAPDFCGYFGVLVMVAGMAASRAGMEHGVARGDPLTLWRNGTCVAVWSRA